MILVLKQKIFSLLDSYDYSDDEYKTEFRELVKKAQYLMR